MTLPQLIGQSTHPSEAANMRAVVLMCLLHVALAEYQWLNLVHQTPPPLKPGRECETNRAACSCCAMLQEVNRLETQFNTSLMELEAEIRETQELRDSFVGSRTAFSAALDNKEVMTCIDDTIVEYKHVFINLGGGYDPGTGIFTVPHTGVYSLAVTIYSDAGSPDNLLAACAGLQVNDKVVVASRERNRQDQEDSVTITVALLLKADDKVSVRLFPGCFLCDDKNHYNTFSAFLLFPSP